MIKMYGFGLPVPSYPLGTNTFPFTRQPKVFSPVWVAGGNLSLFDSFLQLLAISNKKVKTISKDGYFLNKDMNFIINILDKLGNG